MAAKEVLSKVIKGGLMIPFLLLEVETIIQHEDIFLSYFKNFLQYQGFSFYLGKNSVYNNFSEEDESQS